MKSLRSIEMPMESKRNLGKRPPNVIQQNMKNKERKKKNTK